MGHEDDELAGLSFPGDLGRLEHHLPDALGNFFFIDDPVQGLASRGRSSKTDRRENISVSGGAGFSPPRIQAKAVPIWDDGRDVFIGRPGNTVRCVGRSRNREPEGSLRKNALFPLTEQKAPPRGIA